MLIKEQKPSNFSYIVLPVHNRKAVTLKCLEHLEKQGDLNTYRIVVIDDGSTDGTTQAISQHYPTVHLLKGDGNLWWTGAIKLGMEYAVSKGAEYCIWLNDDTLPDVGAIQSLLNYCISHSNTIAGGNILDPHTHEPSYGGVVCKRFKILPVFAKKQDSLLCDGLNGNLVCLPINLVHQIGYPNTALYPHYHGDTIYTHRAQRAGYKIAIVSDAIAYCQNDHEPIRWFRSNQSLSAIVKERLSIKSPHYWKAHLAYYQSFLGTCGIVLYICDVWLKMLLLVAIKKILRFQLRLLN